MNSVRQNSYKYTLERMLALWVVVLAVLVSLGFVAKWVMNSEMEEIKYSAESLYLSSEERMLVEQAAFLADLLIKANIGPPRDFIRKELLQIADQLQGNHSKLRPNNREGLKKFFLPGYLSALYDQSPHNITAKLSSFIAHIHTLASMDDDNLNNEHPSYQFLFSEAISPGKLRNSLAELIKEYQDENNNRMVTMRLQGVWLLSLDFLMLFLITILIIFPMFRKVEKNFAGLREVNVALDNKTKELQTTRLIAFSMMEDAQIDKAKIQDYMEEIKESNKELEQFAFVASHDLQEPLRIVSSYSELWAKKYKGQNDEVADKYILYITQNVARMQEMISDLLSYSRIGKTNFPEEAIDAGKICDQAIANLKLAIQEKNASVSRDNLPMVWGNGTQLTRVFQNLIGNAVKFCTQHPQVHVSAVSQDGEWIFAVKDNGIGINPQYFDRIFKVFQRLHNKSEFPGTGIGLSICKKIVERNGGRIWIESQEGAGSTFYFSVPIKRA